MASWQAHVLDALVRVTVKRRMKGQQDLETVRATLNRGGLPTPPDATFEPATIGGVPGEWVRHAVAPARATLLYLHGGGYFACSPRTHRPITAAYAGHGFAVFAPDYRLAPEHPFPAALEDAQAVFRALAAEHGPVPVSGDSAGGGLCLALCLAERDAGRPAPAAAALFSPWTDLAATGDSIRTNARREAMFWAPGAADGGRFYLGGADAKTPLASPLYAALAGLPPLLIHVGEREMLRDDSTRLADRARAAGVAVDLRVWPVLPHVWQMAQHFVPEARESLAGAAAFLHRHVAPAHGPGG